LPDFKDDAVFPSIQLQMPNLCVTINQIDKNQTTKSW
jgi:hypothetical protein